jgi:transcriptional regulator with GAF, ATPase, and Fis domain
VLQERQLERLGGGAPVAIDLRVIAATNRDLPAMVAAGRFRQDLYYRLSVFPIPLPPLRARLDDLPLLVDHFVERAATRFRLPRRRVTPEGMRRLAGYDWPGNLRELGNAIERATIVSAGEALDLETVVPARLVGTGADDGEALRAQYLAALEACGWVIEGAAGAAAKVGLHPNTFRHRIKKLGITRPERATP